MFLCLCRGGDDLDAVAFHGLFAFRGNLVVGNDHGDLFGIEQLGDAAFSEFIEVVNTMTWSACFANSFTTALRV